MTLGTLLSETKADRRFISISTLRDLVTLAAVESHLRVKSIELSTPLNSRIVAGARKLIAVLILLKLEAYIDDALKGGASDDIFPANENNIFFLVDGEDKYHFCHEQWVVPLALDSDSHMELPREAILPFVEKDFVGHGAFGKVYKIKVAGGHLTHEVCHPSC
jgi:hypothetical protein